MSSAEVLIARWWRSQQAAQSTFSAQQLSLHEICQLDDTKAFIRQEIERVQYDISQLKLNRSHLLNRKRARNHDTDEVNDKQTLVSLHALVASLLERLGEFTEALQHIRWVVAITVAH